jgi:hypothetical protein
MKLPTRIAITLTTAITGLMVLSTEAHMTHIAHQACLIVGGAILGLIVHPAEAGTIPTPTGVDQVPPIPAAATQDQPL